MCEPIEVVGYDEYMLQSHSPWKPSIDRTGFSYLCFQKAMDASLNSFL